MRIKTNTPDLFVASQMPWLIATLLFFFTMAFTSVGILMLFDGIWAGLIFGGGGGGMGFIAMAVFVERLQLILDARSGTATLRSRTIMRHRESVHPLKHVLRARVDPSIMRSDKTQVRRPVLIMEDDTGLGEYERPVTEVYSSGSGTGRLVDAVNEWLEARRQSVSDVT